MNDQEESVFAQLLFKKYEEKLDRLNEVKKAMALAEVELADCQERIRLLQFQIAEQAKHEERLLKSETKGENGKG